LLLQDSDSRDSLLQEIYEDNIEFMNECIYVHVNVVNFVICQQKKFCVYHIGNDLPTKRFFSNEISQQLLNEEKHLVEMLTKENVDVLNSRVLKSGEKELCESVTE